MLVLHSHVPYCRKAGVWPFGEEWVFEAMAETYIPLLDVIWDLGARGFEGGLTVGFTPVLLDQLRDAYMLARFDEYLEARIAAAEGDMRRFAAEGDGRLRELAGFHRDRYERARTEFHERYGRDIPGAFRALQDAGRIQILAGAATHAYLPLLSRESSVRAQIEIGCDAYRSCFGRQPSGIWLPECGYRPAGSGARSAGDVGWSGGLERVLSRAGLDHFFVDTRAIQGGVPLSAYGTSNTTRPATSVRATRRRHTTHLAYSVRGSSLRVLGRDDRTAVQVWSSEWGYPADGAYREFHRRDPVSGLHYWRVTNRLADLGSKELYQPEAALARAREHASHFVTLVERLLRDFHAQTGKHGVIVAPFDVELFGHWWFEGLDWLRWTLEGLSRSADVDVSTAARYLERHPPARSIDLVESSWGLGGAHFVWDNETTAWMWEEIHDTEAEMEEAARAACRATAATPGEEPARGRFLRQAAREALLVQSSDWPFLVTTEQAAGYASARFREHRRRFLRLLRTLQSDRIEPDTLRSLEEIEAVDALFPDLDHRAFLGKQGSFARR